jgi:hypothetical protein
MVCRCPSSVTLSGFGAAVQRLGVLDARRATSPASAASAAMNYASFHGNLPYIFGGWYGVGRVDRHCG